MNESIKKGFIKRAQEYGVPSYKAESLLKKAEPEFLEPKDYLNWLIANAPVSAGASMSTLGILGGGAAGYYLKDKDKRTWKDALAGAGVGGLGGAAFGHAVGNKYVGGLAEGYNESQTFGNKVKILGDLNYNPFKNIDPSEASNTALGALAGAGIGGIANYQGNPRSALKGALVGGLAGGFGTNTYRDADRAGKQLGFSLGA